MKKKAEKYRSREAERLRTVIDGDRLHISKDYASLVGYDLEKLLGDYFELVSAPVIELEGEEGRYSVTVRAKAVRVKPFGILP